MEIAYKQTRISQTAIEDKERREEVARLMADIGQKVNMKYDCSGSGSNIYNANNAFISYGYKTSGVQDYSEFSTYYSDPHTSFFTPASFNAPFYMRGTNSNGEGHAFVVDGFFESFMVIVIVRDVWIMVLLLRQKMYMQFLYLCLIQLCIFI